MDGSTDAHSGRDVADVGLEPEGQSRPLQAEGRAGDEQQEGLHGLHDGAGVQDAHFSAPAGGGGTTHYSCHCHHSPSIATSFSNTRPPLPTINQLPLLFPPAVFSFLKAELRL